MNTVLLSHALFPESFPISAPDLDIVRPPYGECPSGAWLREHAARADGLVSMFDQTVGAELLDAAPRLKVIANVGVGYNNIDTELCRARGITVCNTPDPVTEPTAELAMALLADAARGVSRADRRLRAGDARWGVMENMGETLWGKRLGIVGMGRIGQALARRAVAAGMRVAYYNRHRVSETTEALYGAAYMPLDELLRTSDYLSLHTPLTSETHHLIGASELARCKPSAVLVNTSRGAVVDEAALVDALRRGIIAAAALDVFEFEPRLQAGLAELDNVTIVPHIGTATRTARNAMAAQAWSNITAFFAGQFPPNRVV